MTDYKKIGKKGTALFSGLLIASTPLIAQKAETKYNEALHNTKPIELRLNKVPNAIDTILNNAQSSLDDIDYTGIIPDSKEPQFHNSSQSIDSTVNSSIPYALGKDIAGKFEDGNLVLFDAKGDYKVVLSTKGYFGRQAEGLGIPGEPKSKSKALKYLGIGLGLVVIGGIIYLVACRTREENEKPKVMIQALTNVVETDDNAQAVSNATIKYTYGGKTVTASPGQLVDIAEVDKGTTVNIEILVNAANHLTRKMTSQPMTGTHNYTINIKDLTGIDMEHFIDNMASNGYFTRLKPPSNKTLNVYFNPDEEGTGKRLPQAWIDETKRVFEEIKKRSNGEITNIVYHENGNKKATDVPSEGEVYVYEDTQNSGVSNITKENTDGSIKSILLYFNSSKASTDRAESEILDSVLADGGQDFLRNYWNYVDFVFKRPTGNTNNTIRYRISTTGEEQKYINNKYSTSKKTGTLTTTNYQPSSFITGPSNPRTKHFTPIQNRKNHNMQKKNSKKRIKK